MLKYCFAHPTARPPSSQAFFLHLDRCAHAIDRALTRQDDLAVALVCPVCVRLMHRPVAVWPCAHVMCRACQARCERASKGQLPCPECAPEASAALRGRFVVVPHRLLERALRLYAATVPRLRRMRAVFAALMECVRARDSLSGGGGAVAASTEVSVSERVAVIDADIDRLLATLEDATEKGGGL